MDFAVMGCMVFFLVLSAAFSGRIPSGTEPAIRFATILVCYMAAVRILDRSPSPFGLRMFIRAVFLYVAFPFAFMALGHVIEFINPFRAEAALMEIDRLMFFGANPNAVLQDFLNPFVVEGLQVVYAFYYPLFMLGFLFLFRRRYSEFMAYLTGIACLFWLQFIGYTLVPARSPYIIADLPEYAARIGLHTRVEGLWLTDLIRHSIHSVEGLKFDCFPSGHTAGAIYVTLSMFAFSRRWGIAVAPWCAALVFSTVYLQYHYVIDLVAGAALGVGAFYLGRALTRRYPLHVPADLGGAR